MAGHRGLERAPMRSAAFLALLLLAACTRGPKPPSDEPPAPSPDMHAHSRPDLHASAAPSPETAALPSAGQAENSPFDPDAPEVGGVTFRASRPFTHRAPTTPMRVAEYVVGGPRAEESALLVVHHFPGMGGSVDENLARWIGQFTQPDGSDSREAARMDRATVRGLEVWRVDVSGTYTGMQPATGAPAEALDGQRLVGVIVRAPGGPVFFKLVGPASVVETALPAFDSLVASLEPAA